jgi:hypothetical protein
MTVVVLSSRVTLYEPGAYKMKAETSDGTVLSSALVIVPDDIPLDQRGALLRLDVPLELPADIHFILEKVP